MVKWHRLPNCRVNISEQDNDTFLPSFIILAFTIYIKETYLVSIDTNISTQHMINTNLTEIQCKLSVYKIVMLFGILFRCPPALIRGVCLQEVANVYDLMGPKSCVPYKERRPTVRLQ